MGMTEKKPLVSIIVITYNSTNYVLETLESAKAQTYQNIELIITDDASTDDTVAICDAWLKDNKERFVRIKLIKVDKNTGIPKNCNRGLFASKGEWVKTIAGDDALMTNCIQDNIQFVQSNTTIKFCFSNFDSYRNNFDKKNIILYNPVFDTRSRKFSELNQEFQLKSLISANIILAPTIFFNRKRFIENGGFDETYNYIEDITTLLNWLQAGNKIYYLPKKTIKYRFNVDSISNDKNKNASEISPYSLKLGKVLYERFYSYYTINQKIFYHIKYTYFKFFIAINNTNLFIKVLRRIWYFIVQMIDRYNYNSLNKIYNEYRKKMLKDN